MKHLEEVLNKINGQIVQTELQPNDFCSLKTIIEEYHPEEWDIAPLLLVPADKPYGKNILFHSPQLEVALLNWAPGKQCMIHGHGDSFGLVYILKGQLLNVLYFNNFSLRQESLHDVGDVMNVTTGDYHQLENTMAEHSISLHFYVPPVDSMTLIDLRNNKALMVTEDCGAWMPEPGQLISQTDL